MRQDPPREQLLHGFSLLSIQAELLLLIAMGREEQQEEREVLDSIFPDEITGTHPRQLRPSQF